MLKYGQMGSYPTVKGGFFGGGNHQELIKYRRGEYVLQLALSFNKLFEITFIILRNPVEWTSVTQILIPYS